MKAALKIVTLGMFASCAMCTAFQAESSSAKSQPDQKRCFAHPKSQTSHSRMTANETSQELHWTTNCTSAFFATVSGTTRLSAYLQRFHNGEWTMIDSGLTLSATVGPGTYRVFVVNEASMPGLYTFTWRKALG